MNEYGPTYNEIDGYLENPTDAERAELAKADAAIELALLLYDARESRGLTQAEAAKLAGLRQQAVSRFEQPETKLVNTKLDTLRRYFTSLNYIFELSIKDAQNGASVGQISFSPYRDALVEGVKPTAWGLESAQSTSLREEVQRGVRSSPVLAQRAWTNNEYLLTNWLFADSLTGLGSWHHGTFSNSEGQALGTIKSPPTLDVRADAQSKTPSQKDLGSTKAQPSAPAAA